MNHITKLSGALAAILLAAGSVSAQKTSFKFEFGSGKVKDGYTSVTPSTNYTKELGYGFDNESTVKAVDRGGKDPLKASYITNDKPFFFSVDVPEGNYKVTVTFGDAKEATVTTVKAESRRLMLEKVETKPGEFVTKTFVVNIRKPEISAGVKVGLKDRELKKLDWDDKLTLEFNNKKPAVCAVEIAKADDQITVYLAGNSTVVDQDDEPWASWGQMVTRFFKPGVAISDHAESGLTLASFKGSHRLDKVLSTAKAGDYLFVEFGHNDQKEKGPNAGAWKAYTESFKYFIAQAKAKGMISVVVTSTSRRAFSDTTGKVVNTLGDFPAAARKVAQDEGIAMIDVNAMTADFYNALGKERSTKALVHYPANTWPGQGAKPLADNTHFNPYGAYEIAKMVIEGIKSNHLGLEKFIIDAPHFDPSHPDDPDTFSVPVSPPSAVLRAATFAKPDGN
ncbi:rhamnogalacturonan acetylesterase [Mucilaginibacter sp. HMF5004]|uniref:rhamnogalacturonan acetylesterase n=1 Tax=Mucilaginibacter rivuli TaxID=2857527 RepID=UPI001C5EA010|nr:rhamnogalacturonan acetylesterase [Mucilaginibacter rivuli]MBW4889132.1 rhamnogalacturonan acetylesterase [Mucilaginibacter rivuli]